MVKHNKTNDMETTYNYFEEMREALRLVIDWSNYDELTEDNKDEIYEQLYDEMWCNDMVTGNASGSYTFSTWQAEENLCHNMDLLKMACDDFGGDLGEWVEKGAEHCDVCIRCYILSGCLWEVIAERLG